MSIYTTYAQRAAEAEKKAAEQRANTQAAAEFLCKAASLLRRANFVKWLNKSDSRFEWAGQPLHDKLLASMLRDLRIGCNMLREDDVATVVTAFAAKCETEAQALVSRHNLTIRKSDTRYTVPAGADMTAAAVELLSQVHSVCSTLQREAVDAYVREGLYELHQFAECRLTLTQNTGSAEFERVLAGLTMEYMLKGYPTDVLCYDAIRVRNGEKGRVALQNGYCSSHWLRDDYSNETLEALGLHSWNIHTITRAAA